MKKKNRRIEIIKAGIKIIASKGIQSLTIKNISKNVGITEPAIYRHFTSKLDIMLNIIDYITHNIKGVFDKEKENKSALNSIENIFKNHFKTFKREPDIVALLFSEELFRGEEELGKKMLNIMKKNQSIIHGIIEYGQKTGEIRDDIDASDLTIMILGSLRLITTKWYLYNRNFDIEIDGMKLWKSIRQLIKKNK